MKKILLLLFAIIISYKLFSQKAVGNKKDIERFYKTTTCIVLEDVTLSQYNVFITKAVEKFWKITPYKFITYKEFETQKNNPNLSFLLQTEIYPEKKYDIRYNALTLVLGEPGKKFEELPEIGSFPLTFNTQEDWEYLHKLGTFLIFIQNHVQTTYKEKLNQLNVLNYYKKNAPSVGNKTIYFTQNQLSEEIDTEEKIKKYTNLNAKIVDLDKIQEIIFSDDTTAIIAHLVTSTEDYTGTIKSFKYLIGANDGRIYYFDEKTTTNKDLFYFTKEELKNLKK